MNEPMTPKFIGSSTVGPTVPVTVAVMSDLVDYWIDENPDTHYLFEYAE